MVEDEEDSRMKRHVGQPMRGGTQGPNLSLGAPALAGGLLLTNTFYPSGASGNLHTFQMWMSFQCIVFCFHTFSH